jgi:hypothetical protein
MGAGFERENRKDVFSKCGVTKRLDESSWKKKQGVVKKRMDVV